MPARRPYASRGVPHRATVRRPGHWRPRHAASMLVGLLVLIGLGVGWALNPFASGANGAASGMPASSNAAGAPDQQSGDIALPTPDSASVATGGLTPTP